MEINVSYGGNERTNDSQPEIYENVEKLAKHSHSSLQICIESIGLN